MQRLKAQVLTCKCGRPKTAKARLCRVCSTKREFTPSYLAWREAVLEQDGNACQCCGSGDHLQAHHIENYRRQTHLRFVVSNGIALCKECHDQFHRRFGKWGNNAKQVRDFLEDEAFRRQPEIFHER